MRKKCVPGTFCIENMTFALVVILGIMVVYLYYVYFIKNAGREIPPKAPLAPKVHLVEMSNYVVSVPISPQMPLNDPYVPPLKNDIPGPSQSAIFRRNDAGVSYENRVPVNINTNSADLPYTQVGILTKNDKGTMILPLMGRGLWNGRDKWQYYTMSNTAGALNTKLPISVNGRSCTGEYGCDSISNGDTVYVEGYNDTFRATIYENSVLRYLPI